MHFSTHSILWGLTTLAVGQVQVPIYKDESTPKLKNYTLDFDELHTNHKTGIGYNPRKNGKHALPYQAFHLEGFTVFNPERKGNKNDAVCAISLPNAVIASHVPNHALPRITIRDLTKSSTTELKPNHNSNATFGMIGLNAAAMGEIPKNSIAGLNVAMVKMPAPGEHHLGSGFLPILRGEPAYGKVPQAYLGMYFGPGQHASRRFNLHSVGVYWPPVVDSLEVTTVLLTVNEKLGRYEPQGEWPFCLDDITLEVAKDGYKVGDDTMSPTWANDVSRRFVVTENGGFEAVGDNDDAVVEYFAKAGLI